MLSPFLLNLVLEKVKRDVNERRCMELNGTMTILSYADDIIILGNTQLEVVQTMGKLILSSQQIGLVVNETQTKYMITSRKI